jgi:hypothetical protein
MTTMQIDRAVVEQATKAMLNFPGDISDEMFESIRALKAVLAQQAEPVDGACLHGVDDGACKECYAASAEPVAWGCNRYIEDDNGFQIGTDDPELAWGRFAPDDNGWWPLYTAPPQRKQSEQAEPVSADPHTTTLRNLLECCLSWEPDACVLGNVTARQAVAALRAALAQEQAEPLTIERLRYALVASRIIPPEAVEDPDEYDDGVTLHRIEALHRRLT